MSNNQAEAPTQASDNDDQQNHNNRRQLGYSKSANSRNGGGCLRQKRASFSQQRSGSGQSSASSSSRSGGNARRRNSSRLGGGGGGDALRRQTSSIESGSINKRPEERVTSERQAGAGETDEEQNEENLLPSSNADYERIRNETLLFFLDRLYLASTEGKEARTLHDLSCLFGTREFKREMRQIVGASRNGLKKFLQSFPSLFQIEGDKVYLTQLKQDTQSATRDYNKEAVDYFRNNLLQFGTSLVPIRNLFGFRSQASQEVRHVSGKNARDFKRFLKANEDVFELLADGEHVMLKSVLKELRENSNSEGNCLLMSQLQNVLQNQRLQGTSEATSLTSETVPSLTQQEQVTKATVSEQQQVSREDAVAMDPYLNKRFAHLIEQCLEKLQAAQPDELLRISLENLHEKIKLDCQNELFLKMVKTIDELKVFLRMHPKLFKRFTWRGPSDETERDYVALVTEEERRDLEASMAAASLPYRPQLMARQYSALESDTKENHQGPNELAETQKAEEKAEKSAVATESDTHLKSGDKQKTTEIVKRSEARERAPQELKSKTNQGIDKMAKSSSQQQQAQLRANAPPFVPQARAVVQQQQQQQHYQQQHYQQTQRPQQQMQRSLSNLGPRRGMQHVAQAQPQNNEYSSFNTRRKPHQPVDQRSAIRNYLTQPSTGYHSNNLPWATPAVNASRHSSHHYQHHQATRQPIDLTHPLVYASTHSQQQQQQQVVKSNSQQAQLSVDDLRARTVDIVREASNIITRIMNTTDAVAFDCKGYNLGFDGQITLIQFGFLPTKSDNLVAKTMDNLIANMAQSEKNNNNNNIELENKSQKRHKPEVCVFDLITNPELAYCLKPLLESDKIVKIVHDVRNKSNALYVQFKIILNNVFDTQVANLVIQQQDTGKPAYKSRYISMSKLCEVYADEELLKYRNLIKSKTRHSSSSGTSSSNRLKDVNFWRARPLTRSMIIESTMDVYCLIGGIYQNLKSKLKPDYEPLFEQLNLEGVLARIKPDEIKSAKKGRKIDLEVIDLKRKLYRDATGPVVLSNREIRLLRHVDLTDEVRQKIQQCKKVVKKLERLDMKAQQLQANQMQSLISQNSDQNGLNNRENDPQSLISSSSTGETSMSTTATSSCSNEQQLVEDEERILSSFMDSSSMFDELKDKMIESSNLLDSIEDSLRTPL